jgi:hypothetical protein
MSSKLHSALNAFRSNPSRFIKRLVTEDRLVPQKKQLIDIACQEFGIASFADLGGVWNVDGGYTFYAMDNYRINEAIIADMGITPGVRQKQGAYPRLRIIEGNFGTLSVRDEIGNVDGIFFFDTLLHQVRPDWDEVLGMYANAASIFLVFNQQFTNFDRTTRLLDLGRDSYFRNVPHLPDEEPYKTYFHNLDAIHPTYGRTYRDFQGLWQWGITDTDLIARMTELGFRMQFYKNCGLFGTMQNVENHAFVFSRNRR